MLPKEPTQLYPLQTPIISQALLINRQSRSRTGSWRRAPRSCHTGDMPVGLLDDRNRVARAVTESQIPLVYGPITTLTLSTAFASS